MSLATLSPFVQQIKDAARTSYSEARLEGELNQILKQLLTSYQIPYNPAVNEKLKSLGYTQVNSDRPDSVFGHVVLDYKGVGKLSQEAELTRSKKQIERYLDRASEYSRTSIRNPDKWAGVLLDGERVVFCHSDGKNWIWSRPYEVSEASLLTLIQTYRSLHREPLTSELLNRYFGKGSDIAEKIIPILVDLLSRPKHRTQILFQEWKKLFEQVSTYDFQQLPSLKKWARNLGGKIDDSSTIIFAFQTYYSIVVKLLTAELLAASQSLTSPIVSDIANAPGVQELFDRFRYLENGDFYKRYRIANFLEGDFFSWYTGEESPELAKALIDIAHIFKRFEPATFKLKPEKIQDLLKEFYSGIVDEQIRHDLGEYYTPDWLARYLLDKVGYTGEPGKILVDPACGSGTFLVESIIRLRAQCEQQGLSPTITLDNITECIRGVDLNPLAVISARANYILAISDLVFALGQDIEIPVYLSDSIYLPEEKGDVLTYDLDTRVKTIHLQFPTKLVKKQVLGTVMQKCEEDIERGLSPDQFIGGLRRMPDVAFYLREEPKIENYLEEFYSAIMELHTRKPPWDSIWCRILKQTFSPKGFEQVDFIVGNPPWVRWSRLPVQYRSRVKRFCENYGLVSGRGYSGGIESDISTVLVFSAVDNWLKEGGRVGVLITWTVFKANSARGFRLGKLPDESGIMVDGIEDLSRLKPFADAANETGIYIGTKVGKSTKTIYEEIPCRTWYPKKGGRIEPSLTLPEVLEMVEIRDWIAAPIADFGSPLYTGDREDFFSVKRLQGESVYLNLARRGTVNDLSRVYWVKIERYSSSTNRALIRTLRNDELPKARAVLETHGAWVEADLLFPLIRGRNVGRYSFEFDGWYQLIPNKHYSKVDEEEHFIAEFPAAYQYFSQYQDSLIERATYRRYLKNLPSYSIYCIGDYSFSPYKVVWPEQQDPKRFRAAVISDTTDSIIPNKVLVPDHKLYFVGSDDRTMVHYLCAVLNSRPARKWLGGFLLKKQIGTSIFEYIRVPEFDPMNSDHLELAYLSMRAHEDRSEGRNDVDLDEEIERYLEELVYKIM